MTERLGAERENGSLAGEEIVFRFARMSKDYQQTGSVSPAAFDLSPQDKASTPPTLTVWMQRLTTVRQALNLIPAETAPYDLVCPMKVDDIRSLRPEPNSPDVPYLDVIWEPLKRIENESEVPDGRPGADGHAGITNLDRPFGIEKKYYKSLRSKCAELASRSACLIAAVDDQ